MTNKRKQHLRIQRSRELLKNKIIMNEEIETKTGGEDTKITPEDEIPYAAKFPEVDIPPEFSPEEKGTDEENKDEAPKADDIQ